MHAMELQHNLFQILTPDITKFIIFVKIQIYFIKSQNDKCSNK